MSSYVKYNNKICRIEQQLVEAKQLLAQMQRDALSEDKLSGSQSATQVHECIEQLQRIIELSLHDCTNARRQLKHD